MGAEKAELDWLGRRAVDRVAAVAAEAGAKPIVTVGPVDYGYPCVADDTPLGGPVGGVLAGARWLIAEGVDQMLVLAVDAPTLTREDIAPLLGGEGGAFEGLHFPCVIPAAAFPADAQAGWPMARLIDRTGVGRPPCPP